MGRDRRQNRRNTKTPNTRPPSAPQSSRSRTLIQTTLVVVLLALIGGTAWMSMRSPSRTPIATGNPGPAAPIINAANTTPLHTKFTLEPKTLNELLDLPVEQLAQVNIARMNLLCATGLPGAEKVDAAGIDHALATLDEWAKRVTFETNRHLYRVTDPRYARDYRFSEAYLRASFLLQVLQQDLGVKYDMSAVGNFAFNDSRVAFIHGMVPMPGQTRADMPGGTCASMPVMYVAVGRRLGYPLKLVTTNGHVFVRWDGLDHANPRWRERFNIEGAGEGFSSYPDDYYKTWPYKVTDEQVRANGYLISLTPQQELALFLASRGHCGEDNKQFAFAARCFENAYRYEPGRPSLRFWFVRAATQSRYRPSTPPLAEALARRRAELSPPSPAETANDMRPSVTLAAAAASDLSGLQQPARIGQWRPQAVTPDMPPSPGPFVPGMPQVAGLPPAVPKPYQPYQPPMPGQPPR